MLMIYSLNLTDALNDRDFKVDARKMFSSENCLGLVTLLGNMIGNAVTDCANQKS